MHLHTPSTSTHPLLHPVEFTEHDLHVNEEHNVADDEEGHIAKDSLAADFSKADGEYLREQNERKESNASVKHIKKKKITK